MRAAILATALLLLPAPSAAESAHDFRLAETKRQAEPVKPMIYKRVRKPRVKRPKLSRGTPVLLAPAAKPATRIAFPPPAEARVEGFLERFNAAYQPTK